MLEFVTLVPPDHIDHDHIDASRIPLGGRREASAGSSTSRVLRRCVLVALTVALASVVFSYVSALTYPGATSFSVRTVDWIRDHGGGPVINTVENWWYSRRHESSPPTPPALSAPSAAAADTPEPLTALGPRPTPGEGQWQAGPVTVGRTPALYATYLHPDPTDATVLAGVTRFDQRLVATRLIAGTKEPDRQHWPEGGQVPAALRPQLIATFNSGFKVRDSEGGYFAQGHVVVPLRDGAASLVIDGTGRASVGMWGRDAQLGPNVAAVRQNLSLIVDNGAPVPGLDVNADHRWGSAKNQLQYTWRSGIGVDPTGNLYYVAGDQLTLSTLARALAATGAVRGMELDMHPKMVHLFVYRNSPGSDDPIPIKLLADMRGPADRYLVPDLRDFIAVTRRP